MILVPGCNNFFSAGVDTNNSAFFEGFSLPYEAIEFLLTENLYNWWSSLKITVTLPTSTVYCWNRGFIFFRELFKINEWWHVYFNRVSNWPGFIHQLCSSEVTVFTVIPQFFPDHKDAKLKIFLFTICPPPKMFNTSFTDNMQYSCLILVP